MKNVLRADFVADLDVGAVQRADGERAVQRQLHVAGAGGLGAGGGDLLGEVGGGNDQLGVGDVVVGDEDDLEPVAHQRVVVHHVGDVVDQADDQLGHAVAGRGLAAEDHRARRWRRRRRAGGCRA
jgi:hypothetical protein